MSIAHFSGLLPAFGLWALVLAQGAFADEPVAGYVNGTQEVLYKTSLANGNEARRLKFSLTVVAKARGVLPSAPDVTEGVEVLNLAPSTHDVRWRWRVNGPRTFQA